MFKYQEPEFYARLFDNSEEGYCWFPPGRINVDVIIKLVSGALKLYLIQEINSVCVLLISIWIFFVGEKVVADCFKYDIITLLKSKYRIKFVQDVALNHVIEKGNPRFKIVYTILRNKVYIIHCFMYLNF